MTPAEALPRIRAALDAGRPCRLVVTGTSMLPFLRDRQDAVILVPPGNSFQRGDILFYLRSPQVCILHRVHSVRSDGVLLLCGDAQLHLEPIHPSQVIARVSQVERGGKLTDCGKLRLRLPVLLWQLLRPVRPYALAALSRLHIIP